MKDKSIAQQKFGKTYERLNMYFPSIEGSFLSDFDSIAVMGEFTGKRITYIYTDIKIVLTKSAYINLSFNIYNKRIILNFYGIKKEEITKEIKEKYNISYTYNKRHAGYNGIYEFKYNRKNCIRMLNIIKLIVSKEWVDKK